MENKVDPQLLMNDQMKAVLQKSAELAGDAFVTDVGFAEMRENYVRERRFAADAHFDANAAASL